MTLQKNKLFFFFCVCLFFQIEPLDQKFHPYFDSKSYLTDTNRRLFFDFHKSFFGGCKNNEKLRNIMVNLTATSVCTKYVLVFFL